MIADTAILRREKGVVSVNMETMVGTLDSSRERKSRTSPSRTIQIAESDDEEATQSEAATPREEHHHSAGEANGNSASSNAPPLRTSGETYDYTLPPQELPTLPPHGLPSGLPRLSHDFVGEASPSYVPPPEIPDQNSLSEKERVRQAETRLLPSQPPVEPAGPSNAAAAPAEDDLYDAESIPAPNAPSSPGPPPTAPAADVQIPGDEAGPSAPTEDDLELNAPGVDKQERERQRLMGEASAPPEVPNDALTINGEPSCQAASPNSEAEPSAPVLDEDDDGRHDDDDDPYASYGVGAGPSSQRRHGHAEPLPAYER
jgi:hypothetical protein